MRTLLLFIVSALALSCLPGCSSHQPKSEAHIYDGDAPNIKYAPGRAGGPQSVY